MKKHMSFETFYNTFKVGDIIHYADLKYIIHGKINGKYKIADEYESFWITADELAEDYGELVELPEAPEPFIQL